MDWSLRWGKSLSAFHNVFADFYHWASVVHFCARSVVVGKSGCEGNFIDTLRCSVRVLFKSSDNSCDSSFYSKSSQDFLSVVSTVGVAM